VSEQHTTAVTGPEDDVERLLARLEPMSPPASLQARVLSRTTRREPGLWTPWLVLATGLGFVTALLGTLSGYWTGQELVRSGAFDLLRLAMEDWELVQAAPSEYLLALAETVPWPGLLATLVCVAVAYALTRPLSRVENLAGPPAGQPA
jgi:hypothetical protein